MRFDGFGFEMLERRKNMEDKVKETIVALCNWIQGELKNTSSMQTESILPEIIKETTNLIMSIS